MSGIFRQSSTVHAVIRLYRLTGRLRGRNDSTAPTGGNKIDFRYKLLLIEDDESVEHYTCRMLEINGYDVVSVNNGSDAKLMAKSHCPDVILLDLGLPDMDGMSVLKSVRGWSQVPVIVVSSRGDEEDKVTALENGADDYVVKPFGMQELLARIRVALRHARSAGNNAEVQRDMIEVGDMRIDYQKHRVYIDGVDAELTQNEFRIVALLGQFRGTVLKYDDIMTRLWGPNSTGNNQILRVNMANIRRKIEPDPAHLRYIITENGVGYRMLDDEEYKEALAQSSGQTE